MEFEDFLLMSKIVWHYSQSKYSMLVTEDLFGPQTSYNNYASSLQHMYLLYKDFQLFKCFPSNAAVENLHISQMGKGFKYKFKFFETKLGQIHIQNPYHFRFPFSSTFHV